MRLYISKATLELLEKHGQASLTQISCTVDNHMCVPLEVAPSSGGEAKAGEREAFEAWASKEGHKLELLSDSDEYVSAAAVEAWDAWQARAALATAQQSDAAAAINQDAERYRWLRDVSNDIEWPLGGGWDELSEAEGQEFDSIIDNARNR